MAYWKKFPRLSMHRMPFFRRLIAHTIENYFGSWFEGRIGRASFLVLGTIATSMFLAICIGFGLSGGISNNLWLFSPVAIVLLSALSNLLAKRLRDIGVSGWPATIVLVSALVVAGFVVPGYVTAALLSVIVLILLATPRMRRAKSL